MEGPKKDGMSPDVVTGVLRSPGWASGAAASSLPPAPGAAAPVDAGPPLPGLLSPWSPPISPLSAPMSDDEDGGSLYKHVSKLSTLNVWAAATAASLTRNAAAVGADVGWWW